MEQKLIKWTCGNREKDTALTQVEAENADDAIRYIQDKFEKDCKKKFGLDISNWFTDDEDHELSEEDYEKLLSLGFKPWEEDLFDREWIGWYEFYQIWVFLVMACNPSIKLKKVDVTTIETRGGYGL